MCAPWCRRPDFFLVTSAARRFLRTYCNPRGRKRGSGESPRTLVDNGTPWKSQAKKAWRDIFYFIFLRLRARADSDRRLSPLLRVVLPCPPLVSFGPEG
jgi:hypothetical protein